MRRLAIVLAVSAAAAPGPADAAQCTLPKVGPAYAGSVAQALRSGRDLWGERLLRAPNGPSYAGVSQFLKPLLLAGAPRGRKATGSGVYYLAFGRTAGGFGADSLALHVADGSEIISRKVGGPSLSVFVGGARLSRYGSCIAGLSDPHLYVGYLPILQNEYAGSDGTLYEHESFATRLWGTRSAVSFVRLTVDARNSAKPVRVVLRPSAKNLRLDGNRLVRGGKTFVVLEEGASFNGSAVTYSIQPGEWRRIYFARLVDPSPLAPHRMDAAAYIEARRELVNFWAQRLSRAARFVVPEQRVLDAAKSLLIQNTLLSWRYSAGNTYEDFSVPETVDTALVMGAYGFQDVTSSILNAYFWQRFRGSHWKQGAILLGVAGYYRLSKDRAFVEAVTPTLRRYVAQLSSERARSGRGTLDRAPYSSDIGRRVYGLHSQAVAWDGLRSMAQVWTALGYGQLARHTRRVAAKLGGGLRTAVRRSQTRMRDGSLFVPVQLFDGEQPYDLLTSTRHGTYWNLVAPYALATGLLPPGSPQAKGVIRYLLRHGSRVLGLVRAGAYSIYGRNRPDASGTDQVYGVNVARFLADNDLPDQLVLSLYGQLAAGMTPRTFVAGEAASIAPVRGNWYRTMYLPPNSGSNSAYLETLRLMLVHETRDSAGRPRGLELAFATPRPWLRPGKRIDVIGAPTTFGPLTYSLERSANLLRATIEVPPAKTLRTLRLRLRLPAGEHVRSIAIANRSRRRFDPRTETIDLSSLGGTIQLEIRVQAGSS